MAPSDRQINKPHHGYPKRTELPNVNINTGTQSINTESLFTTMSYTVSGSISMFFLLFLYSCGIYVVCYASFPVLEVSGMCNPSKTTYSTV